MVPSPSTQPVTPVATGTSALLWVQSPFMHPIPVSLTSQPGKSESHLVVSDSLRPHGLYSPWNSPGQNTAVGSLSLLQGIFSIQGLNPGLLHCKQILYQLNHQGSPRILEWVAYPFSSGSSWPRNWTTISCTAGEFFTYWAMREALISMSSLLSCQSLLLKTPMLCIIHMKRMVSVSSQSVWFISLLIIHSFIP